MPLVLFTAEGNHVHRTCKEGFFPAFLILKDDVNRVRIFLIFVDKHQRPFRIRA